MKIESSVVGTIASMVFICLGSTIIGKLLYHSEHSFLQTVLGCATLLVFMALSGTALILLATFSEIISLIVVCLIAVSLGVAFVRFGTMSSPKISSQPSASRYDEVDIKSFLLGVPFLFFVVIAIRLLWLSRTGEGVTSVWLVIPNLFAVMFLLATLSLAVFVFFARISWELKLGLICLHSFLLHSLFLLVWYPGRYGDPWSHLGETRYIIKAGMPYAYSWMLKNSLWIDLVKYKAQYAIVAFLERMFTVDVYWVHILLIPVLWSVFTPIIAYKTAETLATKKSRVFPLLTAMVTGVFPFLVAWGTVSVPNSLGFIFFFLSVALLLLWMNGAGRLMWFLALLASVTSSFAHLQPGFFAFMLLLFVSVIQKTTRSILRVAGFLLMFFSYPLMLYVQGSSFSLSGLFQVSNFMSFQSEISTILLIFGLVGLVLGLRDKLVSTKASLLFFVFYIVVLFEYYLTKYGMTGLPFGPGRILVMADFLLVPFVALGLLTVVNVLRRTIWGGKRNVFLSLSSKRVKINVNSRSIGLLLIGVFLSFQTTSVLFQAYPTRELVKVQPSVYELEAIRYIDSNSPDQYVVLCEPGFASLAAGFLGADYAYGATRGLFGPPEWWYPTMQMYLEMTKTPSIGIMQQAMKFGKAKLSYFVVSVRNPDFDKVVKRTLDILPAKRIFGDDKLYVFMYPLPVFEEPGSLVKVFFDDGLGGEQNIQTRFDYMVENEINSTLTLSGYTSYNVTEFPMHWTFLELTVNTMSRRLDNSSDINTFIYVRGLQPTDVLTIKWLFNRRYPNVGWKEDSFKRLDKWRAHDLYRGTMVPIISSDGNILRMSYLFTSGSYLYYYYVTSVNVSTNDYPYLLMRWRSISPVAVAAVYFELGSGQEIVPLGSISPEWSTIVVPLTPNSIVRTVMVGLSNARNQFIAGSATLEIGYILFSAKTTP